MLGRLSDYEIVDDASVADVIIVNTCGFIDAAKSESIEKILELHSIRKSDSVLVASGCLSERYKEELKEEIKEIDIFTGVGDYAKIDELIEKRSTHFSDEVFLIDKERRVISGSKAHAYIKISEGCNQKCSFCAIPTFKGRLKSRDIESIVLEVRDLVESGYVDFSFISQDSSSYLKDRGIKDGLLTLIDNIEKIDGVKSARILYLYPSSLSKKVIEKLGSSKIFLSYFDIPIQHISDGMLETMKRGANKSSHLKLLDYIRAVDDSFIRTSIIVGHPRESDSDFLEVCDFVQEFGFDRVNIFAYSDEEGTSAYQMDEKIDKKIVDKRIKTLSKIVDRSYKNSINSMLNREVVVIIEGESSEHSYFYGARDIRWAPHIDGEILINDSEIPIEIGGYYIALITQVEGEHIIGRVLQKVDL